ncbi:senecionine N-oxygenase-like [Chironomus tepperi]|uniref:senecionine N-oxygenase-like n=1 Tax=Chironomus tepperi TaxID=113505 RepID=UPI00391F98C7
MKKIKLAVIGAGASGLCALKNAVDYGCEVVAFEQSKLVGGLWNYTDLTDKDEYGLDVHSSMYENLVTNLPIEIMCYPNEPFPKQPESFVSSAEVLNYYIRYAEKFNLLSRIKFEHHVFRVRPLLNDKWEIIVKNLRNDNFETHIFDSVLVCSGHFHTPYIPNQKGQKLFKGKQMHSHTYRSSKIFNNEMTLIVGGNNSAVDLVIESSKNSKLTIWSHHLNPEPEMTQFEGKIVAKPDILELTENGVKFIDGTFAECSLIIYATGYLYSYPFLSMDSGVLGGDYVKPLWMHCLSINNPSLGFIGLPNLICPNQMFQLQVEFCLTFMTEKRTLPSKDEMLKEMNLDLQERWDRGLTFRKGHFLGHKPDAQLDYYNKLSQKAGIIPIMPCIVKIHSHAHQSRMKHFTSYRNVKYKIVSEDDFEIEYLEK